jgi:tetratricopeptide (TPR) repeat protein
VEAPVEEELDEAINLQSEDLAKAAAFLTSGNIDAALDEFSSLIKQESHLPEVISHLQDLVKKQELNKKVWRTLGDAHFNANHLQEALDAYSHADGLIDTDDTI